MRTKRFLIQLGVISFFTYGVLIGITFVFPVFKPHDVFSYLSAGLFICFCLIAFGMGKKAIKSSNKYRFIHVLVLIIIGKMMLSLLIILAYVKLSPPMDKTFVIPFFIIYLIYTVFEVYFLEKVAKEEITHPDQIVNQQPVTKNDL